MTVKELIEQLKKMPQDAKVFHIWDGSARTEIYFVWNTKKGVMTADYGQVVYNLEDRPVWWADDSEYWQTPSDPSRVDE